jgi:hypothetical protein
MVPREDQEKINYTQKVDFAKLRSELTAMHGSELNPIKNDQERLSSEISRLSARLREEVQRAQSSVKLDLNLEKGRIREESSVQELKVKETDTRIEKEVGDLRGMLESVKFSTLQWLIGVCTVGHSEAHRAVGKVVTDHILGYCRSAIGCMASLDVSTHHAVVVSGHSTARIPFRPSVRYCFLGGGRRKGTKSILPTINRALPFVLNEISPAAFILLAIAPPPVLRTSSQTWFGKPNDIVSMADAH